MRKYIIIVFFFITQISFGQSDKITRNELIENFKRKDSYVQKWITCNNDSTFYKSDTLHFYKGLNYNRCKKYIIWEFDNSKSFYQVSGENFNHYDGINIITDNDRYKMKIVEQENQILFNIYKHNIIVESFIVYELEYNEKEKWNRLTLIRKK